MQIKKITNYLLKQYPLSLQEEWDESGFLNRGNLNQETKKVFVCLDLNEKVINEAIKQKAKLVVSHHPIFTKNPDHKILSYYSKLIKTIKKNKITVLSLHTCFDNSDIGMNFIVATKINLHNVKWYKNAKFVMGNFRKSLVIKEIAKIFKNKMGVSLLKTNCKPNDSFKKIAICSGAGLSVFAEKYDQLQKQDILLVTGDINHHGWQDLNNYNLKALDVGHNLENCFSDFVASLLKQQFPKLITYSITSLREEKPI